ncbi:sugar-binding protein [Cellvibrio sp. KY-GH-1]|uniref:sugar-binding protein n=1 Tax=Cellvibrio sp. KY-GH-1 TaxID=2303332 RepID=UPI001782294F|nr:sugar-binding protein [Cellvibrio sp. KY-GH-1]
MSKYCFSGNARIASVCAVMGLFTPLLTVSTSTQAQTAERGAYQMPYTRYEADVAARSSNAQIIQTTNFDIQSTASEASQQKYIALPAQNAYVEWTATTSGSGVTMRYTMPDSATGTGLNGSVDIYINGQLDQTVPITSYWAWQYFINKEPENTPHAFSGTDYIAMRFDETHFKLNRTVNVGDKIRIQKSTNDTVAYGIDFIELEPVAAPIAKPTGYVSIADYGATPNDNISDLAAFNSAVAQAGALGTGVYLPPGKWDFNNKVVLNTSNIGIKGAGMWHTEVYYSNPAKFSGGMIARVNNVEVADIYFNTINNRRFANPGDYMIYKAFMGTWGNNSKFTRVWAEHFEVGAWLGGYDAPYPVEVTNNLVISQARFRNNYADGINFSQGTSNSVVEHSNIRNSGDDGLAMWPSNSPAVPEEINNTFRFNTVEHVFRAGGVAIFGGKDHKVHNLLIRDCFGGSGIRFTTDFPGYTFSQQGLYRIYDIDINNCGTSYDLWHRPRGSVEFYTPNGVSNMQFDNIKITNSQRHGVQLVGNGFNNITFNNVTLNGTGLDASVRDVMMNSYGGVGIWTEANSGSVTFNNVAISNFEDAAIVNQNNNFNLVVTTAPVPLQGISFANNQITMGNGSTRTVDVIFNPPQATNKNLTWTSSDNAVISITGASSGSATLNALKVGSVTITARSQDGNFTATMTASVTPAVSIAAINDTASEAGVVASVRISAPQIASAINVAYTISGSASSGDYSATPALTGVVALSPSKTEQIITIAANDDAIFEGKESLFITLQPGSGYQLSTAVSATVNILDNELPVCTSPAIGFSGSAPVVDTSVDSLWNSVPARNIDNVTLGGRPADYAGKWRAIATADRLFLLVEVNDVTKTNDSGASWWEDDVIEIFIDGNNSKGTSYDGINDFQLGFRWNDAAIQVGGNSVNRTNGIVKSHYATASGHTLEVSIPWATIGVTPAVGDRIGLDVSVDDDDNGGARDSQLTSFATTAMGWSDPSLFGAVYITQCGGNFSSSSSVVPSSSSRSSSSAATSSVAPSSVAPSSVTSSSIAPSSSSRSSSSVALGSSSSSAVGVTSYRIVNRWQNNYLYDAGDYVAYGATANSNAYKWVVEDLGNGFIELRNLATGDYMHIENQTGRIQASARNTAWDSSKWAMETVDSGFVRLRNRWQSSQYIHEENLNGNAQHGAIYPSWWSAQWKLEPAQ